MNLFHRNNDERMNYGALSSSGSLEISAEASTEETEATTIPLKKNEDLLGEHDNYFFQESDLDIPRKLVSGVSQARSLEQEPSAKDSESSSKRKGKREKFRNKSSESPTPRDKQASRRSKSFDHNHLADPASSSHHGRSHQHSHAPRQRRVHRRGSMGPGTCPKQLHDKPTASLSGHMHQACGKAHAGEGDSVSSKSSKSTRSSPQAILQRSLSHRSLRRRHLTEATPGAEEEQEAAAASTISASSGHARTGRLAHRKKKNSSHVGEHNSTKSELKDEVSSLLDHADKLHPHVAHHDHHRHQNRSFVQLDIPVA